MDDDAKNRDDQFFPSTKFERGRIAAKTGIKVGANYARYVARKATRDGRSPEAKSKLNTRNAQDIFSQLTKLRGTALKLAQGLSMESSAIPAEFAEILSQAQYQVPPMNSMLVRRIIKQNLGDYPENVFASFDAEAIAAASLGQVHKATTHEGDIVAVKVQYPNVRDSIDSDLKMLRGIAAQFIGREAADPYLKEVGDRLREETDYIQEGKNLEYFAEVYTSDDIITPRCLTKYTTSKVLTMTFIEGVHLDEFVKGNPSQELRDSMGQILFDFAHTQITADHLAVHVDAHPGNFLFREDGKVGVLDFGCIKRFPRKFRDDLVGLFAATLKNDPVEILRRYKELDFVRENQPDSQRKFMTDILGKATSILVEPYRSDVYDFSNTTVRDGFKEMMPQMTGKEAFKNRGPVGSPHFVFVNRLVLGFYSILSGLEAKINVVEGRNQLLELSANA